MDKGVYFNLLGKKHVSGFGLPPIAVTQNSNKKNYY